eukprot:NODE_120_length_18891_cov_0.302682.p13 type:complete len:109 gc:universal NODE_120_length_18891_cov_0.302682:12218-11892(-)
MKPVTILLPLLFANRRPDNVPFGAVVDDNGNVILNGTIISNINDSTSTISNFTGNASTNGTMETSTNTTMTNGNNSSSTTDNSTSTGASQSVQWAELVGLFATVMFLN